MESMVLDTSSWRVLSVVPSLLDRGFDAAVERLSSMCRAVAPEIRWTSPPRTSVR